MKRTATITSKGQLTIPADIRRHLDLREGDQVEFVSDDGRMWLRGVTPDFLQDMLQNTGITLDPHTDLRV